MTSTNIIVVVGARPHVVKAGTLVPALCAAGFAAEIAFTGSRGENRGASGDETMTFYGVDVESPRWFLDVGDDTDAVETGEALVAFERLFAEETPDAVMVIGDVNPTLAAAIGAAKAGLKIVHLEAGMRCRDRTCTEEVNRLLITRVADVHLAATEEAVSNLKREGVPEETIHFVGSIMAESVLRHADDLKKCRPCEQMGLERGEYVLASFHRPSNLHDPVRLEGILEGFRMIDRTVVIPDAAGVSGYLTNHGLATPANVRVVPAAAYSDMLALERDASVIVTDSGGVQEEACVLGTPCVTVRSHTEHVATVSVGANRLSAASPAELSTLMNEAIPTKASWVAPKRWDKAVSGRVVRALRRAV